MAKNKPSRKKQRSLGDFIARAVTILAVTMGVAYILLRIINWVHFF